jgi:ATP-dependent DNA helicase RecG
MPEPVFINRRGVFKVVFYKKFSQEVNETNITQEILDYCIKPRTREHLLKSLILNQKRIFLRSTFIP